MSSMPKTSLTVIAFDFATHVEREIPSDQARAACDNGLCCWIDLDLSDAPAAETFLAQFGINAVARDEVLSRQVLGRYDIYDDCLHVGISAPVLEAGRVTCGHVDLLLGERFLITLHRGPVECLSHLRRSYRQYFGAFARSLGFLLFELWDHLIESYRTVFATTENEVEALQSAMICRVDDALFNRVATLTSNLLLLRRNVLADREVLRQLATHKSMFVAETTQPYLLNMVGAMERLGDDLMVEREILAETLNLHLGIVSHRTNRLLYRLTLVSIIFLPLTFLCGVYGMNFDHQPEFHWTYGYEYFWGLTLMTVTGIIALMKYKRWW